MVLFLLSYIKVDPSWIRQVNANLENLKLLEENNKEYLKELEAGKTFLNKTQKTQITKKKMLYV